ncbi:hypothetical protein ACJX0J_025763, partial [Zea mays]
FLCPLFWFQSKPIHSSLMTQHLLKMILFMIIAYDYGIWILVPRDPGKRRDAADKVLNPRAVHVPDREILL